MLELALAALHAMLELVLAAQCAELKAEIALPLKAGASEVRGPRRGIPNFSLGYFSLPYLSSLYFSLLYFCQWGGGGERGSKGVLEA